MKRIVILFLGLLILFGGNCTKNPTGPGSVRGPILYAIVPYQYPGQAMILFIDTSTDSLVDTLVIPYNVYGWGVSPGGSTLYLLGGIGGVGGGVEIDTRTKTIRYAGPLTGRPTPDGRYLIYSDSKILRVIDAHKRQVLFEDSIPMYVLGMGWPFDERRNLVYGAFYEDSQSLPRKIGVFDYRNLKLVDIITPGDLGGYNVPVVDIVITRDGRKLYYTSSVGGRLFTGIDLVEDRIVVLELINSISYLGITPDNRSIYLTDPGGFLIPPEPTEKIEVYSPFFEKSLVAIDVCQYTSLCSMYGMLTDQITATPDGRKAYVSLWGLNYILVIDTQNNTISKVISLPSHISTIGSLVIQPPINVKF